MYGKIFDSMYEGTLHGHWQAIVALQQMLILCNQDGVVDMTPQAIAARTSIPLEIIEAGIKTLGEPDPYSRTRGEEGRRIVLLDEHRPWGWRLVNYAKYQQIKNRAEKLEADRIRIADKRNRNKNNNVAECSKESQSVAYVAPVTVTASASIKGKSKGSGSAFALFWLAYPKKKSKGVAERAWATINPDEQLAERICAAVERAKTSADWLNEGGKYIPHPATWLRAKGWEDEIKAPGRAAGGELRLAV